MRRHPVFTACGGVSATRSTAGVSSPWAAACSVGRITAIEPDHAAGVCRVTAADGMERLESVPAVPEVGRRRDAFRPTLPPPSWAWAGIAPDGYALDNGRVLLTGGPRAVWDVSAGRALRRLQREEHGLIYADGLGRVRLEAASVRAGIRNHQTPASLARFSISDTAGGTGAYAGVLRRSEDTALEDAVTFRYRRSSDAGRQRVWSLNEALEIPANGEQRLLAAPDAWDVIDGIATRWWPARIIRLPTMLAGDGADVSGQRYRVAGGRGGIRRIGQGPRAAHPQHRRGDGLPAKAGADR